MIGDPTRLVVRAGFPRLSAAEIAPFRERSTSFVVDAEMHAKVAAGETRSLLERYPELRDQITYVD